MSSKTFCMQSFILHSLALTKSCFPLFFFCLVKFSFNCLLTVYIVIKHNKCSFDYLSWLTYWAEWSSPAIRAGTGELLTTVWYLLTDTFILTWISCTSPDICEIKTECLTKNNSLEIQYICLLCFDFIVLFCFALLWLYSVLFDLNWFLLLHLIIHLKH